MRQERAFAQLTGFFGALALVLAAIGLYGVMSYSVARRTSEIGVRMALGARTTDVRRLILRVSSMLFGLSPHDPVTILAAALVMLSVAALSGYLPARRAARVDPMEALRYE